MTANSLEYTFPGCFISLYFLCIYENLLLFHRNTVMLFIVLWNLLFSFNNVLRMFFPRHHIPYSFLVLRSVAVSYFLSIHYRYLKPSSC